MVGERRQGLPVPVVVGPFGVGAGHQQGPDDVGVLPHRGGHRGPQFPHESWNRGVHLLVVGHRYQAGRQHRLPGEPGRYREPADAVHPVVGQALGGHQLGVLRVLGIEQPQHHQVGVEQVPGTAGDRVQHVPQRRPAGQCPLHDSELLQQLLA